MIPFTGTTIFPPFSGPIIGPYKPTDKRSARSNQMPVLIWDKRFEDGEGKKEWDDMVHSLCDKLLGRRASNNGTTTNPFSNYDLYFGRNDPNSLEVKRTTEAAGAPGNADYRSYFFFSTNVDRLVGTVLEDGPEFSVELLNPTASLERIDQISQDAAEHFMRKLGDQVEQSIGAGVGKSLTDPNHIIPDKEELIFAQLREKEQEALVINDLLTFCLENYSGRLHLSEAYRDSCIVGQEWVEVEAENLDPKPKRLDPRNISWIGPETFNSTDELDAISVHEMKTYSQIILKWGSVLKATGKASLQDELTRFANGSFGNTTGDTQIKSQADINNWVESAYANYKYSYQGSDWFIGEQRVYFKVARLLYVSLWLDDITLTTDQMDDLNNGRLDGQERLTYVPEKEGKEGVNITTIAVVEQHKAVRLGDRQLVYNGKFPRAYRDPNDPANIKYPISGYVSKEASLVTKGANLAKLQMSAMYQLQKLINMVGVDAVAYDMRQKPDGYTMEDILLTAKEGGVYLYDSGQVSGDDKAAAGMHMKKVPLGLDDSATHIMNMVLMLQNLFDTMCGVSPTMKGLLGSRQGNGVTDAALAQGDLIQRPTFFRHQELEKAVMLAMANIGKYLWAAKPGHRTLILQKFGRRIIALTKDLSAQVYGLLFRDGQVVKKEKDYLNALSQSLATSGKITVKQAIDIYSEGNAQRATATLKDGLTAMEKIQAALEQQRNEGMQAQAQATQADTQAKLTIAQGHDAALIRVAEINAGVAIQRHEENLDQKNDIEDVRNAHDLQKMSAQHVYATDNNNQQATIQAEQNPPVQ